MNHTTLAERVATQTDMPLSVVTQILGATWDVIVREVADGGTVTVTNFGSWRAVDVPPQLVHNPQTRKMTRIDARRVMRFRVAPLAVSHVKGAVSVVNGKLITVAKRPKGAVTGSSR